jgi:hypothetical protein
MEEPNVRGVFHKLQEGNTISPYPVCMPNLESTLRFRMNYSCDWNAVTCKRCSKYRYDKLIKLKETIK